MSATVAELAPSPASPARARAHVREALTAAGLEHLVDDAVLLVTELVTNAVLHAGTRVELQLDTAPPGVRVEVHDRRPGAVPGLRGAAPGDAAGSGAEGPAAGIAEHGRGLVVLDAVATRWGTTHARAGKSVWFELERPDGRTGAAPAPAPASRPARPEPDLAWSLALTDDLEARLTSAQVQLELVHRLADALDLDDVHLLVQDEPGEGWVAAAVRGAPPAASAVADVRRGSAGATGAVVRRGDDLLLPVRGRGGAFGALVLCGAGHLGSAGQALARLVCERLAVLVRDDRAERATARERGSLALLAEASEMFSATLDVQLAATLATQLVVPRFARWAALHTVFDREHRLDALAHADEGAGGAVRAALADGPGLALVAHLAVRLADQHPLVLAAGQLPAALRGLAPGGLLALPLVARRRLLGVLLVAGAEGSTFTAPDVAVLHDLARRAAMAVDNARLYEERTEIARALQASLLPPELPPGPHVDFGARYVAAGEGNEVGGDFYDVFALPDDGWAVAIGDVCGKGAGAAAITGLARNVLRLLLRQGRSPSAALRELNASILDLGDRGRFCTCAVATVHRIGTELLMRFCVAGHPAPVVLRPGREPSPVGGSGTVVGVLDDVELADESLRLAPGDALVLYTDGVTERRRGSVMFGDGTLLDVLSGAGGVSADAVAGLLERAVRTFSPEVPRDDLAVLVVRAPGPAG